MLRALLSTQRGAEKVSSTEDAPGIATEEDGMEVGRAMTGSRHTN